MGEYQLLVLISRAANVMHRMALLDMRSECGALPTGTLGSSASGGLTISINQPQIADRKALIGKTLRTAHYRVSCEDVGDFLGVMSDPNDFVAEAQHVAPPSFAPLVAVLGLLRTFDWKTDFWFDYRDGTAMFGEQSIEFHRPLFVGESVAISAAISDVYEKQGKQTFDVVEVTFDIKSREEGDLLMSGQQSYILFK